MNKYSLSALVAAGLLAGYATSASAADLGGNCCADLEERIAELEATTARKGNRKVSLTVSGWVSQQVMYWDDGFESNVYVSDIGTTLSSNVKFTGQATIAPGYSAGYVMHLETVSSEALLGINQNADNGRSILADRPNAVQVVQSYWFIKSEALGKVSVGLQSHASDNTAILVDGSGSLVPANYVAFDYGGFFHGASARPMIADIACMDCNGVPNNAVRYDSPSFAGFSVSASWGEDDFWDVAARYAGEFSGIKVAVAA
ncbi:MAG: porin, partial [Hyphomicrobium sp.]